MLVLTEMMSGAHSPSPVGILLLLLLCQLLNPFLPLCSFPCPIHTPSIASHPPFNITSLLLFLSLLILSAEHQGILGK